LYHFQQRINDSGVAVNSIVTEEERSGPDAPPSDGTESSDKSSMTAVIAAALSGGLVVVGLAAAVLCRQQRYGVHHELQDRAAGQTNGRENQKFLAYAEEPSSNNSIRIISYESNSDTDGNLSSLEDPTERQLVVYKGPADGNQEYMLDAPKSGSVRKESKGASFKMLDGPDLVASAPATWDDGQFSMAESTVYTRSNPSNDLPRPEYNSKKRGQKFRPWDKGTGNRTKNSQEPRRAPMTERPPPTHITTTRPPPGKERSRLWKPFNKNELRKLANEEGSVSSMKPRASASRNKKKAPPQQRSEEEGVFLAPITRF
jgi:hypothetical protein